jgi:ABC-type branched-subunit amino acid transport system substrate-binding protein
MRVTRPSAALATLAVAAVTLVAACGGGGATSASTPSAGSSGAAVNTPGVTATSILLGTHQPLTGPAAPGYDEIAAASQAFFNYVNSNGGVFGRKIKLDIQNDQYNPADTTTVVKQLVEQDNVFAIFEGLGTPTHSAVVNYLNQQGVPDLFVASGCSCWNEPATHPDTFGWQPDYTIEGKILGQYIEQHFKGEKVGLLLQDDDFGKGGQAGIKQMVPAGDIVSTQFYTSGTTTLTQQMEALKASGAKILVSFTVPIYTAIALLTDAQIKYAPQYVVSNVGSDAVTLAGLLTALSKNAVSSTLAKELLQGMVTDTYLPAYGSEPTNSWIQLFTKIKAQNPALLGKFAFDGNIEYGMANAYTMVQALVAAGKNLTRAGLVAAVNKDGASWTGPGLVPFQFSATDHAGYTGVQVATIQNGAAVTTGPVETTGDASGSAITSYTTAPPAAPANGLPTGS